MTQRAVDHSTGGAIIGASLRAAGIRGVFRYAAAGRSDVNITTAEARDLKANGISLAIVNEHSAAYLLGGWQTGHDTALGARDACRDAGIDDGVIYMGGDSEALQQSQTNLQAVAAAMDGAANAIGPANVGYYGSYLVIAYLAARRPWIQWFWQTAAWSGGLVHPRANAYQYAQATTIAGVSCDVDILITPNWGQRDHHATPPVHIDIPENPDMITSVLDDRGNIHVFVAIPATSDPSKGVKVFELYQQDSPATGWVGGAVGKQKAVAYPLAQIP